MPALLIGVPLGIWCAFSVARQGAGFAVLNIIQTIPSSRAVWPVNCATCRVGGSTFLYWVKFGVAGTGMTPALIALVLHALLPLVRGVVAGLNQVPRDVLESARAMGMNTFQRFVSVQFRWRCRSSYAVYG